MGKDVKQEENAGKNGNLVEPDNENKIEIMKKDGESDGEKDTEKRELTR